MMEWLGGAARGLDVFAVRYPARYCGSPAEIIATTLSISVWNLLLRLRNVNCLTNSSAASCEDFTAEPGGSEVVCQHMPVSCHTD